MALEALIGHTITAIWMETNGSRAIFEIDDGDRMAFITEGDCCSSSWFNDVIGLPYLLGTVQDVEQVPMTHHPDSTEDTQVDIYGYKITTDLGTCEIIYRNENNGYYGGWCEKNNNTSLGDATQIFADWSLDQ